MCTLMYVMTQYIIRVTTGNSHHFIIRQVPGEVDFMLDISDNDITVRLNGHFYTLQTLRFSVNYTSLLLNAVLNGLTMTIITALFV